MTKKKKSKKTNPVYITPAQVGHLINGTIKNLIDFKFHADEEGIRFLLVLDCIAPETCISINKEPESEEEIFDIMCAHAVPELSEYFENVMRVKIEDGKHYRGFSTIPLNLENLPGFIFALSELDNYWTEIDQEIENQNEIEMKDKNFVEGNGTVNRYDSTTVS